MADKKARSWKSHLWRGTKYLAGFVLVGALGIDNIQNSIGERIRADLKGVYSSSVSYVDMGNVNAKLNGYTPSWRELGDGIKYYFGLVSLDNFKITKDTKQIVDTQIKHKKDDMGKLEELLKSFDNGENVAKNINILIGKLNGRGYDTKPFEEKLSRIETKNMERAYFNDQVAEPVINYINQECSGGCSEEDINHVAVKAGLIFARNVKLTKELDLEAETLKLSDHVSAGFYPMNFAKYLPKHLLTSK
ncbi:hypothetical protein J4427_02310 [Candidatus Woesearchaeota archaeon]|nr:hypothetical protein [Candidatus Woesearchaeota archaeon]